MTPAMVGLTHVSLFSGIGAFDYAAERAGFNTILMCEIDPYCQRILKHHWPGVPIIHDVKEVTGDTIKKALDIALGGRCLHGQVEVQSTETGEQTQREPLTGSPNPRTSPGGQINQAIADSERATSTADDNGRQEYQPNDRGEIRPINRTACAIDRGQPGHPTLLTASPPCQPVSCAGKRRGAADDRWLWGEVLRIIEEARPLHFVLENPVGLGSMVEWDSVLELAGQVYPTKELAQGHPNLGIVHEQRGPYTMANILENLEAFGYTIEVFDVPAVGVGAFHTRHRYWIVGHAEHDGQFATEVAGGFREGVDRPTRTQGEKQTGELEGPGELQPITSHADSGRCQQCESGNGAVSVFDPPNQPVTADTEKQGCEGAEPTGRVCADRCATECGSAYGSGNPQPGLRPLHDGPAEGLAGCPDWAGGDWQMPPPLAVKPPERVNRIKALGNSFVWGQVYPILKAIANYEGGIG